MKWFVKTENQNGNLVSMELGKTLTPEFGELVDSIEKSGLGAEIIATALLEMKEHPKGSPLVCLQIAAYYWDI